jgi:hypothetical protein
MPPRPGDPCPGFVAQVDRCWRMCTQSSSKQLIAASRRRGQGDGSRRVVTVGSESGRAGNTLRGSRGCDSLAGEPRHLLALMPGYKTVAYRHLGDASSKPSILLATGVHCSYVLQSSASYAVWSDRHKRRHHCHRQQLDPGCPFRRVEACCFGLDDPEGRQRRITPSEPLSLATRGTTPRQRTEVVPTPPRSRN